MEQLFERVRQDQGRLDILACSVWGGNERFVDPVWKQLFWKQLFWKRLFWKLPIGAWDEFMGGGPPSFWIAAHAAPRLMLARLPL